ncbi:Lrp/AsnC family transcriptional regulator [Desulfobotulus sp.]|jgi:Lrp/AsnC family leucine-responsive transcriptional regulator|uniref:Lrp/AsnC family transcriptional regulator n=1 Tax=Desulfobotulus sp. TaxID=1940337 RepID=UPI002A35D2A4|nr:Lrp/AsnC family transcriptional regulator [Desulfobotulus sp.]MDY0163387.1 Lrp/AsnC family transcriptional regulator [Desulfobotulus sp.]
MDDISLQILKILQEKARIPNVEVARQVGLAPSAVLERIRKLEKQGIIDGYEVRLNPEKLHRDLVTFLQVFLERPETHGAVAQALTALADVQEVHFISGSDAFLVKLRSASIPEMHRMVQEEIATLPGVVRIHTQIALATHKESTRIPLDAIHTGPEP